MRITRVGFVAGTAATSTSSVVCAFAADRHLGGAEAAVPRDRSDAIVVTRFLVAVVAALCRRWRPPPSHQAELQLWRRQSSGQERKTR